MFVNARIGLKDKGSDGGPLGGDREGRYNKSQVSRFKVRGE